MTGLSRRVTGTVLALAAVVTLAAGQARGAASATIYHNVAYFDDTVDILLQKAAGR